MQECINGAVASALRLRLDRLGSTPALVNRTRNCFRVLVPEAPAGDFLISGNAAGYILTQYNARLCISKYVPKPQDSWTKSGARGIG